MINEIIDEVADLGPYSGWSLTEADLKSVITKARVVKDRLKRIDGDIFED